MQKDMKLNYVKIGKNSWKFFYDDDGYGEFYINFEDVYKSWGKAAITYKDFDYAPVLFNAFAEAMGVTDVMAGPVKPTPVDSSIKEDFKIIRSMLEDLMASLGVNDNE